MKRLATKMYSRGIVLVSGMILLLISSIFAIAGLKGTLLEARIAQRYSEHALLFQQTESALRYAESRLLPAPHTSGQDSISNDETPHSIPFYSLETPPESQGLFETSIAEITRVPIPGSKVRGKGTVNTQASLEFFRIKVNTTRSGGGGRIQLMSTVTRGTQ